VLFVDTRGEARETSDAHGVINVGEATLVKEAVEALKKASPSSSVGVIAPFRAQVEILRRELSSAPVDINTVDQFQGKDRDVILYSCTRSRLEGKQEVSMKKNEVLADLRRLNVAVTRAKCKLALFGDAACLRREYDTFRSLFEALTEENVISVK